MAEEADLQPGVRSRCLIPTGRLLDGGERERVAELREAEVHETRQAARGEKHTGVAAAGTCRGGDAIAPAHASTNRRSLVDRRLVTSEHAATLERDGHESDAARRRRSVSPASATKPARPASTG